MSMIGAVTSVAAFLLLVGGVGCTTSTATDAVDDESVASAIEAPARGGPATDLVAAQKTECTSNDGILYCVVGSDGKLTGAARLCDGQQSVAACKDGCTAGTAAKNVYRKLDLDASCPNKKTALATEVIAAP